MKIGRCEVAKRSCGLPHKITRLRGTRPSPPFCPKKDRSRPKFPERCHPLTYQYPRILNMVRIGCGLSDLRRKDWFFNLKSTKRHKTLYFTRPYAHPEVPSGWICTKFGSGGPIADIINCAEFFCRWLRGFDSVGIKVRHLPLTSPVAVNTVLALPRSLWYYCISVVVWPSTSLSHICEMASSIYSRRHREHGICGQQRNRTIKGNSAICLHRAQISAVWCSRNPTRPTL